MSGLGIVHLPRRSGDVVELLVELEADDGERVSVQASAVDVQSALGRAALLLWTSEEDTSRGWLPIDWRYV